MAVSRHDATHTNAELAHHVGGRNSRSASLTSFSVKSRAANTTSSAPLLRSSFAMGSDTGWPTSAYVPAELTETVGPSFWVSNRSAVGDLQTFPVQTVRIGKVPADPRSVDKR